MASIEFDFDYWFNRISFASDEARNEVLEWLKSNEVVTLGALKSLNCAEGGDLPSSMILGRKLALREAISDLIKDSHQLHLGKYPAALKPLIAKLRFSSQYYSDYLKAMAEMPLVQLYDESMKGSTVRRSDRSGKANDHYWQQCLFCGTSDGISEAHIVNAVRDFDYTPHGTKGGYSSDLDVTSDRNYIPLCGTKGDGVSCHHHFDSYHVTILYQPFQQSFYLHVPIKYRASIGHFHGQSLPKIPDKNMPYKRLLVARAVTCALRAFDQEMLDLPNLVVAKKTRSIASNSSVASSDSFSVQLERRAERFGSVRDADSWTAAWGAVKLTATRPARYVDLQRS